MPCPSRHDAGSRGDVGRDVGAGEGPRRERPRGPLVPYIGYLHPGPRSEAKGNTKERKDDMPKITPETAAAMGSRGGKASWAKRRLKIGDLETELGALDSIDDAMRWLRQIGLWTAADMLSGARGNVCVRCVEVWIRAHETKLTQQVVDELRDEVERLKSDMGQRKLRVR